MMSAVRCTTPVRKSFVQFSELHLSTVVNFILANFNLNEFVIGSVLRTQHSNIIFCCRVPIQEFDEAQSAIIVCYALSIC